MVTTSAALLAFLQSNLPFFMADLYQFTLTDGTVLRLTSFDRDIFYASSTYTSLGPYISRSKLKVSTGLEVSNLDVVIQADPGMLVESQSVLLMIAQGRFSNAAVTVRRAYLTTGDVALVPVTPNLTGSPTGTGDGTIVRFAGVVGAVSEVTHLTAKIEVRDKLYILNRPMPKNTFQPMCWHVFCDAGCGLSAADFTLTGVTVHSGSTTTIIQSGQADPNIIGPPVSAPALSVVSATTQLPWSNYYVVITYTTKVGETIASQESSIVATPGHLLHVASPISATGVTGWNCYVGDGRGNEQLQNSTPLSIGTDYQETGDGIFLTGVLPPQIPTTGYWGLGTISFTSGVNKGLSAAIQGSSSTGALQLAAPLPQTPGVGDTFNLFAGCSKIVSACQFRLKADGVTVVDNSAHFTGCPATPSPEIGSA